MEGVSLAEIRQHILICTDSGIYTTRSESVESNADEVTLNHSEEQSTRMKFQ